MNDNNKEQQSLQLELPQDVAPPEHAKRLQAALQENIMRYENEFGPIRIPNHQAAPTVPFDINKGEA